MINIIDSRVTARDTIKVQLEKEIPPLNEAIATAKAEGKTMICYKGEISDVAVRMLTNAGYEVSGWMFGEMATISWYGTYKKLCEKADEIEKIAKELNLEIV